MGKHRGSITVRSRTETGTVFMLFFPDYGVGKPPEAAEPKEQISEQLA
jgi:hypothetical protein